MDTSSEAITESKWHGIDVMDLREELSRVCHSVMRCIMREEFELHQAKASRELQEVVERLSSIRTVGVAQKDPEISQAQNLVERETREKTEKLNKFLFSESPFVTRDGSEDMHKESSVGQSTDKAEPKLQEEAKKLDKISFGGLPDGNCSEMMQIEISQCQELPKHPYVNLPNSTQQQRRSFPLPRRSLSGAKDRVPTDKSLGVDHVKGRISTETSLKLDFVKDRVPTDTSLRLPVSEFHVPLSRSQSPSKPSGCAELQTKQERSSSKSSATRLGRRHFRTFTEGSERQIEAARKAASPRKETRKCNRPRYKANAESSTSSHVAWRTSPVQDEAFSDARSGSDSPAHKYGRNSVVPCEIEGTIHEFRGKESYASHRMDVQHVQSNSQKDWGGLGKSLQRRRSEASPAPSELSESESMFHTKLEKFVRSPFFDYSTLSLICLNALSMGWQADYMARRATDELPVVARAIEIFFCSVFTLEVALRILICRWDFFQCKDWRWNCFDCLVVALQIAEEFMALVAASLPTNFSFLRVVRVLRLVRVVRLVRILRLISELRTLVTSLLGSLKSFGWTMILLFGLIYTTGIFFTQIVTDHRLEVSHEIRDASTLKGYFGSLEESIMALVQAILGGVSWREITTPLRNDIHWLVALAFCMYIIFSILAMMNVVTGVFVDSALSSAKNDKEIYLVSSVRSMFRRLDLDLAGELTWEQFEMSLREAEMREYFKQINVDISEARGIFDLLDINCSGKLAADEFVSGCMRISGYAKALDILVLIHEVRDLSQMQESLFEALKEMSPQGRVSERVPSMDSVCSSAITEEQSHLQMHVSSPLNSLNSANDKAFYLKNETRHGS